VFTTSPAAIVSPSDGLASSVRKRLSGVDPNAKLDTFVGGSVADRERRTYGPLGIVLVHEGCPDASLRPFGLGCTGRAT
jgi:hypothetical protein